MATVIGSMFAAAVVGFVAVALCVRFLPPKPPGDRIAREAKEAFVGRVVSVKANAAFVHLWLETENGAREVILAEVGVVPAISSRLTAWRARSLEAIRHQLVGRTVTVFAVQAPGPAWVPSQVHVADADNRWVNGDMVDSGLCYALRLAPPLRMAVDDLADLEREARLDRRGCWEFVTRAQFKAFYRHAT